VNVEPKAGGGGKVPERNAFLSARILPGVTAALRGDTTGAARTSSVVPASPLPPFRATLPRKKGWVVFGGPLGFFGVDFFEVTIFGVLFPSRMSWMRCLLVVGYLIIATSCFGDGCVSV